MLAWRGNDILYLCATKRLTSRSQGDFVSFLSCIFCYVDRPETTCRLEGRQIEKKMLINVSNQRYISLIHINYYCFFLYEMWFNNSKLVLLLNGFLRLTITTKHPSNNTRNKKLLTKIFRINQMVRTSSTVEAFCAEYYHIKIFESFVPQT